MTLNPTFRLSKQGYRNYLQNRVAVIHIMKNYSRTNCGIKAPYEFKMTPLRQPCKTCFAKYYA